MVDVKGFSEKEIRSKQIKVHKATVQSGQITNQRQELVKCQKIKQFH